MTAHHWLDIAKGEIGEAEIPGDAHNPRIVQYHQETSLKASDDETPWCSSFIGWVMMQAGLSGTGRANARSWLDWGEKLDHPVLGCVVIFWRGSKDGWQGHVGLYMGEDSRGRILTLGGNQGNKVSIAPYAKDRLLGYRWPSGQPKEVVPIPPRRPRPITKTSTGKTGIAGIVGTAGAGIAAAAENAPAALEQVTNPALRPVVDALPWAGGALAVIAVAAVLLLLVRKAKMEKEA